MEINMKKLILSLTLLCTMAPMQAMLRAALTKGRQMARIAVTLPPMRNAHCHNVLEVSPRATKEEIQTAFAEKVKAAHPDHGGCGNVQEIIAAKNQALNLLDGKSSFGKQHDSHFNPFKEGHNPNTRSSQFNENERAKIQKEFEDYLHQEFGMPNSKSHFKHRKWIDSTYDYTEKMGSKTLHEAHQIAEQYMWNKLMATWGQKSVFNNSFIFNISKGIVKTALIPPLVVKNLGLDIWKKITKK